MPTSTEAVTTEWVFTALTFILVCLRVGSTYSRGRAGVSDAFVVAGWCFFLAQTSMDTALWKIGYYDGRTDGQATEFGPGTGLASREDNIKAYKISFSEQVTYYCELYCMKCAMISFYYSLFPITLPKLRWALHITAAYTVASWLFTELTTALWAQPIRCWWDLGPNKCYGVPNWMWEFQLALHISTDLIIYILPLCLLRYLNLSLSVKLGVAFTFSTGFACIVFAVLLPVSFIEGWPAPTSTLCGAFEQMWAVVVACCPAFKHLLTSGKLIEKWESLVSGITGSYGSGSRRMSSRKASEGIISPQATIGGGGALRKQSSAATAGFNSKGDTLFDTRMEVTRIGEEEGEKLGAGLKTGDDRV